MPVRFMLTDVGVPCWASLLRGLAWPVAVMVTVPVWNWSALIAVGWSVRIAMVSRIVRNRYLVWIFIAFTVLLCPCWQWGISMFAN
jgi:hypothetical protein